ncbi:hypothetical protein FVO59_07890 [Microbacterium esteraromaticum]|uniref:HpcH/HpaI aldolase/citrate lyase domain-containing protein n=1 Tax=Microbacterium esteraromaticum TaxID=57043 RepID=A0A7D7WF56_9MICO|nr:aldolase/citrate lyase family protein [Microbacterium esteraromaticum]QMU97152.1 hypothetical protein FVO59_07890 [Microbacterium esteraromaticum]
MTGSSTLKQRLARGEVLAGAWCSIGNAACVEILANSGAAYVALDQQHGDIYPSTTPALVAAADGRAQVLIRVARNEPQLIEKALDQGADAVIAPLVESLDDAHLLRDSSRFPPHGRRSYGGRTRGVMRADGDPRTANDQVACIALIETMAGVESIEEICTRGGIDAVYIGLNDLALSLGLSPKMAVQEGPHARAVERIASACRDAGIAWGAHASPQTGVDELIARGAQLITVCNDIALIENGARHAASAAAAAAVSAAAAHNDSAPETRARVKRLADRDRAV